MSIVSSPLPPFPFRRLSPLAAAFALAAGCALAACDADAPKGGTGGGAAAHGLAILASDFSVTSVSLYDPVKGEIVDDCASSGGAGFAQELSGDATLPSSPQHSGELIVIDRKNAVLTAITPATCAVRLQFAVTTGGFKANPHDIISVSATKAYVPRFEKNGAPTAATDDHDDGDDVLVVNPSTGAVLNSIPLSAQVPAGADPGIQARPDRGVLVGTKLYVTLGNVSADFAAAAPGRVVVIDTATDAVSGVIDLPDHKSCSAIDYVAATKKLYVSCAGTFSDGAAQAAKSGLVEIDLSGAAPVLGRTVAASAVGGQPVNFSFATVLGDTAFVATLGGFGDASAGVAATSDQFYAAGLDGGTPVKLLDGVAYNFGRVAVDAARKKVFLPDGDAVTPRVRIFDAAATPVVPGEPFESNPSGHLPPREVAWY